MTLLLIVDCRLPIVDWGMKDAKKSDEAIPVRRERSGEGTAAGGGRG
jgi:hypothetical protein